MKAILSPILFLGLLVLFSCSSAPSVPDNVAVQAAPLYTMIMSLQNRNVDMFKNSFTDDIQDEFEDMDKEWDQIVNQYADQVKYGSFGKDGLGDFEMSMFEFAYDGDDSRGNATISIPDTERSRSMRVVKEGSAWKLAQR